MKPKDLHVKQDQWRYDATTPAARTKVKRARSKAKRVLSKQLLEKELGNPQTPQ